MPPKHRGRMSKAEKLLREQEESGTDLHPVNRFALELCNGLMGIESKQYWESEAKRKGISLVTMVERYLIGDFHIRDEKFKFSE